METKERQGEAVEGQEKRDTNQQQQDDEVVVSVVVDGSSSPSSSSSLDQKDTTTTTATHHHVSRLQAQPRTVLAPIQVAAVAPPSTPPLAADSTPFQTPPQAYVATLNSRKYTNRISLFVFLLHLVIATAAIVFFIYKAIQVLVEAVDADTAPAPSPAAGDITGTSTNSTSTTLNFKYYFSKYSKAQRREKRALQFWLPPIEASAVLSMVLALAWQKAVRTWPAAFTINFVLWSSFGITMSAGIMLLCFALPSASALGVALILFSIGTALYSCWVTRRIPFTAKVFAKALHPVAKFKDLNGPAYAMMGAGFLWISLWCLAVIGAQSYRYPPLTILGLVLSLAWTVEVMRNVVTLTVSRVISLYYLRGMQSSTQFCFQRALSVNLGSACLGSLFVPTIEALRIMARGFNLLEEEDEFMFSCAHCCLRVMEFVFHYGNSWAFVHVATYGKGFVAASKSTWGLFERQKMEELVDSDMTSSVCFLTAISSGGLCVILAASWTYATNKHYTATVSLVAFFVGYLMTRIAMALPHACVACYYVCYAENPGARLFDSTIPDRLNLMAADRDIVAPTPRLHRR